MLPIILAGVLVLGLVVAWSLLRQSRWYQHRQLFHQLCQLHRLDRSSRRLLRRLKEQLQLPYAAWIFVDPRCLNVARKQLDIPASQLLQLQRTLFGELPTSVTEHASAKNPVTG
ncbi:MAG: hypothetical protein NZ602_11315 [Thermoguttaceae bacterium]|nr:hypothetical protein [Thermoguttaceae bacterium]MDW8037560.1 hypothetical protein [Thermoguttaceae bacterium]